MLAVKYKVNISGAVPKIVTDSCFYGQIFKLYNIGRIITTHKRANI